MAEGVKLGMRRGRDIIHRYEGNPVISIENLSFQCADVCNAGAVKIGDEYILLVSIKNLEGYDSIYLARGKDGFDFEISEEPILYPSKDPRFRVYEEMGVRDARITALEGTHYITYDAVGPHGFCLGLARTDDFKTVERLGIVSQPDNKAGMLFPKKLKGRYVRLERPWSGASIWINYSEDLEFWGGSEIVMSPRNGFWDASRIGPATPPMAIEEGWLFIYYGIKDTSAGPLFRLGAAILDFENPARLLGRTNVPVLTPRMTYERVGDIPNLVFSCGAILEPDNQLKLYYGAADSCICLGTTAVKDIIEACMESEREY